MIVIPVYNKIILPFSDLYFQTDEFQKLAGKNVSENENVVVLVLKEDQQKVEWTDDSFYPIGVSGIVTEINPQGFVRVKAMNRITLDSVHVNSDFSVSLAISRKPDIQDMNETNAFQTFQNIKAELLEISQGYRWSGWLKSFMDQISSIGTLAVALSPWLSISPEEKYQLLEEDSQEKRTKELERILYEFMETVKVTGEANALQEKQNQDMYRESAIRRQIEYLEKELAEMHPEEETDIQRFARKIEESGMNDDARKEAEKVLNRLRQEGSQSAETGILYDYLDFVTSLPWKPEPEKTIDLDEARRILDEDHYGLKKVKDRIIQQIAVMNLKKKQQGSILLFVGAPGTGKTSIGRSIARALGREYVRVSLGGSRDEADIRGHRRTYIGAMPGRIMDGIQKSGVSNPVMVLDEVDKLASSYNGDPASALLEVLDPEQNSTFTDHYMNVPYDLSDVVFICTANTTDTIPAPLLNRMEVIRFTGYSPEEKFHIAKEHLIGKALDAAGISPDQFEIDDDTIRAIISDYTMEAGVRGLRKRMDALARAAAVEIAKAPDQKYHVDQDKLRETLDMAPVHHDRILEEKKPGVVTGLAWTQVGGEILYIETLLTKGEGKLIITGQLGDVMKESVQIAVSLVKSMLPDKAAVLSEHDLHVHVPEGAVPKDGPSAGITLTTAIASLVTGRAVDPTIAMTGEVSLRGAVTPIGGLPEKLMAAERAGVRKVFIPKENVEDLRDVSREVLDKLEIVPVSKVSDVLEQAGILPELEAAG